MRGRKPKPLLARAATLVAGPLYHNRCWVWKGALTRGATPVIRHGKTQAAHRALYREIIGPLSEDQRLVRGCQTILCVNPYHWGIVGARSVPDLVVDDDLNDCIDTILSRSDRNTDGLPFDQAVIDRALAQIQEEGL